MKTYNRDKWWLVILDKIRNPHTQLELLIQIVIYKKKHILLKQLFDLNSSYFPSTELCNTVWYQDLKVSYHTSLQNFIICQKLIKYVCFCHVPHVTYLYSPCILLVIGHKTGAIHNVTEVAEHNYPECLLLESRLIALSRDVINQSEI